MFSFLSNFLFSFSFFSVFFSFYFFFFSFLFCSLLFYFPTQLRTKGPRVGNSHTVIYSFFISLTQECNSCNQSIKLSAPMSLTRFHKPIPSFIKYFLNSRGTMKHISRRSLILSQSVRPKIFLNAFFIATLV